MLTIHLPRLPLAVALILLAAVFVSLPVLADLPTDGVKLIKEPGNKKLRMVVGDHAAPAIQFAGDETLATAVARQFAPAFGVRNPMTELRIRQQRTRPDLGQSIRYQQLHNNLPVIGGELLANTNLNAQLTSMSGKIAAVTLTELNPAVTSEQASALALEAVAKWYNKDVAQLAVSPAQLSIYDSTLISPATMPQVLVWQLDVTAGKSDAIKEYVLVDARKRIIVLHFNQVDTALDRRTYTANGQQVSPGTLVCNETDPACTAGDTDAQLAHRYAADTYNFYLSHYGRDSIDNMGMPIVSTVHFGVGYQNAFWSNNQMIYGDGFPAADDVVAHELTHGVTENTSNLFYYYQSGAINESLSDVWGEFVDLTNNSGTDTANVRWLMGEDLPGIGAIRNMQNPAQFGDPDRISSSNYYTGANDNGGVHTNSSVNNKAASFMVDGGSFNGRTVRGLGIDKVASVYYEVQTHLLTSGSDYLDLYNALLQGCQNLVGTKGIIADDCTQVQLAAEAVEMNLSPSAGYNPEATVCPSGYRETDLFADGFESGIANWTVSNLAGTTTVWSWNADNSSSGKHNLYATGTAAVSDSVIRMKNPISLPATGSIYLYFKHAFDYEFNGNARYDGGVLEYSTNNGSTWLDAGGLIDSGRNYNGTLASGSLNTLATRNAFTAVSNGYNSTRLNLASLGPVNILFRFRSSADNSAVSRGWYIDDVRIYSCILGQPPNANAGPDATVNALSAVTLNGSGSNDPNGDALTYQWQQLSGPPVTINNATAATATFMSPAGPGTLTFQLTVNDGIDGTSVDSVTITVNAKPLANAGNDQTVNTDSPVSLNGSLSSDPEAAMLSYGWSQTAGTTVTLSSTTTAMPSFTAPATAGMLSFTLTVTDNRGQSSSDSVTITVQQATSQTPPASSTPGANSSGGCSINPAATFDPIWLVMLGMLSLPLMRRRRP